MRIASATALKFFATFPSACTRDEASQWTSYICSVKFCDCNRTHPHHLSLCLELAMKHKTSHVFSAASLCSVSCKPISPWEDADAQETVGVLPLGEQGRVEGRGKQ